MNTFDRITSASDQAADLQLSERHIYGSSRIGMDVSTHVFGLDPYTALTETTRELGHKQYEISNHLGNVLSVITDQKLPVVDATVVVSYSAVVVTATDYSPFGVGLYGRSWSGEYRYGFNGKESLFREGSSIRADDYGFRVFTPNLAKFFSVDPLCKDYHHLSPYQFAENSPTSGIDIEGLEYFYTADGILIGVVGDNTKVMVVSEKDVPEFNSIMKTAYLVYRDPKDVFKDNPEGYEKIMSMSRDVGISNEELNTRAFLTTIRQAENGGNEPLDYNNWNGFSNKKLRKFTESSFEDNPAEYAEHPGFPEGGKSSAAGAYQILIKSYNAYKDQLPEITDFSPKNQDKIAMAMIAYRKAGPDIAKADLASACSKLTKREGGEQFASLPGGSQSNMSQSTFSKLFKENLAKELAGESVIATPSGQLTKK